MVRTVTWAMVVGMAALVGSAAVAQICPPPSLQRPAEAAAVCPTPQPVPAGIGAGPAPKVADLTGPAFDRAYIPAMYQQNTNIISLASQGAEQSTDKNLRNLSDKIRRERTALNSQLAAMYRDMGYGRIPVNYVEVGGVVNTLGDTVGPQFNMEYARTMVALLEQERNAAELGVARASAPRLRDQAEMVARGSQSEIVALQRWINQNMAEQAPIGSVY